jgi:hypothetical protein
LKRRKRIIPSVAMAGVCLLAGCSTMTPKGQPWTIMCVELKGPYAARHVEQLSETLKRTPGIRPDDVFVRHDDEGHSRLFYGTYYRRTDPQTRARSIPRRLQEDRRLIKELSGPQGERYFLRAMMVPVPLPDVGNPEWDLRDVDAAYSLQVAVFEPTDDFHEYKQAAADHCAFLRDEGYEAYYYHGSASSMVTVGAFGEGAVLGGRVTSLMRDEGGKPLSGVSYVTDYAPEVLRLQQEELLKYNLVNGAVYRVVSPDGRTVSVPSQLVRIPRKDEDPW